MVFKGDGSRIADATITNRGEIEYHNGGIDFDGTYLWGTIAQYRPNSTAYVYTARPEVLRPREVLHYHDHLGGVVHVSPESLHHVAILTPAGHANEQNHRAQLGQPKCQHLGP
jgi:hypothetical protein